MLYWGKLAVADLASLLAIAIDEAEKLPCTRENGFYCRPHFDVDLCPSCTVILAIDRAHRAATGKWISEVGT